MRMENFYILGGTNPSSVASAFAPEEIRKMGCGDLIESIESASELPFDFTLVKLTSSKKGLVKNSDLTGLTTIWLDFQPNSQAWPLFSLQLKKIIDGHLTGKEGLSWVSATIRGHNEEQVYYIPMFDRLLDVLDMDKTMFVSGTDAIIKPVFSWAKIKDYSVIHKPNYRNLWKIPSGFYVNEKIKKAVQKEGISGVIFEKTSVI